MDDSQALEHLLQFLEFWDDDGWARIYYDPTNVPHITLDLVAGDHDPLMTFRGHIIEDVLSMAENWVMAQGDECLPTEEANE